SLGRGDVTAIGTAGVTLTIAGAVRPTSACRTHAEAFEPLASALLDAGGGRDDARLAACGHRIVHGGSAYAAPVRVDGAVLRELGAPTPLAPVQKPPAPAVLRAAMRRLARPAQIAGFDTAFFAARPDAARQYGLPRDWRDAGIRRYGFHGLAHAYMYRHVAG